MNTGHVFECVSKFYKRAHDLQLFSMTSNLEFCGSIRDTRYLPESPQFSGRNPTMDPLLNFVDEYWCVSSRSSLAPEEHRWQSTVRCATLDRSVTIKRILGLDSSQEISKRYLGGPIALRSSPLFVITPFRRLTGFHRFRHPLLSPPSTLFRARKPPPAGAAMCRDVFTLKVTSDTRSSMRRWKWVIRSLTEIFRQDFALVP